MRTECVLESLILQPMLFFLFVQCPNMLCDMYSYVLSMEPWSIS